MFFNGACDTAKRSKEKKSNTFWLLLAHDKHELILSNETHVYFAGALSFGTLSLFFSYRLCVDHRYDAFAVSSKAFFVDF